MTQLKKAKSKVNVKNLTLLALMTALVAIFQCIGAFVPLGFNAGAFALVPIVIGAAMLGQIAGLWLGFFFGIIVIATGQASAFFFPGLEVFAVILVLLKGSLAGWLTAVVYKALVKKNSLLAIIVSSIVCPIVNTGIFAIGCLTLFSDGISSGLLTEGTPVTNLVPFVFLTLIGINFIVEFCICVLFSSVSDRIIKIGMKMRNDKSYI